MQYSNHQFISFTSINAEVLFCHAWFFIIRLQPLLIMGLKLIWTGLV